MADNVIDDLVVNLQLNVENFNQRLRQVEDNLNRTRNLTEDNARRVNSANESMMDGFMSLAGKAGTLFAGLMAGNAIKNFTTGMINSGEALYNFSLRTGQSIKDVGVLKNALENLGLSAESGLSELNNLINSAAKLQMGLPGYEQAAKFAALGIGLRDKDGNIKSGEEILRSVNRWLATTEGVGNDPATAARKSQKLEYLGLSGFDLLLRKSPREFDEYLAKHRHFQDQIEKQAQTSKTISDSFRDFSKGLKSASDNISLLFNNFFTFLMDGWTLFFNSLPEWLGGDFLTKKEKKQIKRRGSQALYDVSNGKIDLRTDQDKWLDIANKDKLHQQILKSENKGVISAKDKERAKEFKQKLLQGADNTNVGALDLISQLEGRNNYNIMAGGDSDKQLTAMTIDEVLEYQKNRKANQRAAGKWQIMPDTLRSLKKSMGLAGDELFSAEMQNKMAFELATKKRAKFGRFLKATPEERELLKGAAQNDLSKEWAAVPMANDAEGMRRLKELRSKFQNDLSRGAKVSKRGREISQMSDEQLMQLLNKGASYYEGIATNKALTSRSNFESVLMQNNSNYSAMGTSGNNININNVNVTTDTTNAESVAKGMKSAINSQFGKGMV